MRRNAYDDLMAWKDDPRRKPLLVHGARQVGKTWLIRSFANDNYSDIAWFDLESDASARAAFDDSLSPDVILTRLSRLLGRPIDIGRGLLVLDEVQSSSRALASLKYFREEMPKAAVIGAGSLLGVAAKREGFSAPVGQVDALTLFPMDFGEFLSALGKQGMLDEVMESYQANKPYHLHDQALDLYRTYLMVGGMPEAVGRFVDTGDLGAVARLQSTILDLYIADMAKYATPIETARTMAVFRSLPSQLGKENRKFQYSKVRSGGRASQYEASLAWLASAGIINRCTLVTSGRVPLAMQEDATAFKAYLSDTGLLSALAGISPLSVLDEARRREADLGALTENYVAQAFVANGLALHYWESAGRAEVDFIVEDGIGQAIPVEVKSSANVRSRSLSVYRGKYQPPYSIRLSTRNFGFERGIRSVPLYAAFCITKADAR